MSRNEAFSRARKNKALNPRAIRVSPNVHRLEMVDGLGTRSVFVPELFEEAVIG